MDTSQNNLLSNVITRTAVAAVVGGTASALGGGSFANGAYTAAFQHLFNGEMRSNIAKMTNYFNNGKKKLLIGIYGAGPKDNFGNSALSDYVVGNKGEMFRAGQKGAILDYIGENEGLDINLIGYSRGGNTAIGIVNHLGGSNITVANLLTIDPHKLFGNELISDIKM